MNRRSFLALALLLPLAWGGSLFANVKAHQPGDLLTVLITENSSASGWWPASMN